MKTLVRNFLGMFRRFQMAMFLNVAGLSVAFAAFLILMMQVRYDYGFDRCHPKAERIFLAELCDSVMADGRVIYPGVFPRRADRLVSAYRGWDADYALR